MSRIETVYRTSNPCTTVAAALAEAARGIDHDLRLLGTEFDRQGGQLWVAETASHTVTPVSDRGETLFVASVIVMVTFQRDLAIDDDRG